MTWEMKISQRHGLFGGYSFTFLLPQLPHARFVRGGVGASNKYGPWWIRCRRPPTASLSHARAALSVCGLARVIAAGKLV